MVNIDWVVYIVPLSNARFPWTSFLFHFQWKCNNNVLIKRKPTALQHKLIAQNYYRSSNIQFQFNT